MYSTTAYLYQQKTRVLMIDTSGEYFTLRYEPVYAKRLTINKGVDNVILFEFINQDEKPVNITGSTMVFRLVNQAGDALLLEKEMVTLNAQYGRAKVTILSEDLINIQEQPAGYSISRASGDLIEAVFTNAAAGARAPVDIVDSVYPEHVPSRECTIPTVDMTAQYSLGGSSSTTYPDWALNPGQPINNYSPLQSTEFYSSFIEPTGPITTIQMDLVGYTGTIKVQGAENYQSIFYNVTESRQYFNKTGPIHINVMGWHPILRVAFNNSVYTTGEGGNMVMGYPAQANTVVENGVITSVNITIPGLGYQAPPLVEFIGEGAGAIAVATINEPGGGVASVTVLDGGSGYRPIPPTMLAAQVLITTGRAENILYR